jgi:glycosyltransferase involved in cell wall biosynthesis
MQRLLGEVALRQLGIYQLPEDFTLSVAMPVYNERATIQEIIRRVRAVPLRKEIVIVDDGSTDGTRDVLRALEGEPDLRILYHKRNAGKGAAPRTAFSQVTGDVVLIQDADLEYDPREYPRLIQPIVDGRADVVYGSRFVGDVVRVHLFWHRMANGLLTLLSNIFTNLNLTDMETGYKVFRRGVLEEIELREKRFGVEPELTAKIARRKLRIYEMPISYAGRDYAEGKKIGLKDALKAFYCIFRYWLAD